MSLEKDFLDLAPHTVTIAPLSTVSLYGVPTFGTGSSYAALVVDKSKMVVGTDGREVVATQVAYVLSSSATVNESDQITMPDGSTPRIVKVDTYSDDQGQHNVVVWCGKTASDIRG